jgi:FkbM family methyltransferase
MVRKEGCYEPSNTAVVRSYLERGDVFVDVGANIGYFTVLAAKLVGATGKIFAFEPHPKAREQLNRNLALNGLTNVKVSSKAASSENGKHILYIAREDISLSNTRQWLAPGYDQVVVQTARIDDELPAETKVKMAKIDVEGDEFSALLGMSSIIERSPQLRLLLEFGASNDASGSNLHLFNFLLKSFEVFLVTNVVGNVKLVGPLNSPSPIRERVCTLFCVKKGTMRN